MLAIEFQTIVRNGVIEIPRQYLQDITQRVRVIVLVEEASLPDENLIDHLLAHPLPAQGFQPLTREEIYAR